ncbi:hypothetical protein EXIGLDRAFT_753479 [Exidia glandulosa HHB12029]|uniref:Uncharacterized protein n=1 Tax=Exidia glandulosa HHB12029 TaxID=1314781 RepID=A0A165DPW3_EXIGL|nr:hypothetical protein EXIGLDRAFT_753479 [Exidia glandulosa HHB12029]
MFNLIIRRTLTTSAAVRADQSLSQSLKDGVANIAKKTQFENTGSIGSKFEKGGEVAEVGETVGGPFKSDGAIGKQFSAKEGGVVGGTGQAAASTAKESVQENPKAHRDVNDGTAQKAAAQHPHEQATHGAPDGVKRHGG